MSQAVMHVFRQALAVTGKGMLALFAFMLVFFVMLIAVDKLFPGRQDGNGTSSVQGES